MGRVRTGALSGVVACGVVLALRAPSCASATRIVVDVETDQACATRSTSGSRSARGPDRYEGAPGLPGRVLQRLVPGRHAHGHAEREQDRGRRPPHRGGRHGQEGRRLRAAGERWQAVVGELHRRPAHGPVRARSDDAAHRRPQRRLCRPALRQRTGVQPRQVRRALASPRPTAETSLPTMLARPTARPTRRSTSSRAIAASTRAPSARLRRAARRSATVHEHVHRRLLDLGLQGRRGVQRRAELHHRLRRRRRLHQHPLCDDGHLLVLLRWQRPETELRRHRLSCHPVHGDL